MKPDLQAAFDAACRAAKSNPDLYSRLRQFRGVYEEYRTPNLSEEKEEDLKPRLSAYGREIIRIYAALPKDDAQLEPLRNFILSLLEIGEITQQTVTNDVGLAEFLKTNRLEVHPMANDSQLLQRLAPENQPDWNRHGYGLFLPWDDTKPVAVIYTARDYAQDPKTWSKRVGDVIKEDPGEPKRANLTVCYSVSELEHEDLKGAQKLTLAKELIHRLIESNPLIAHTMTLSPMRRFNSDKAAWPSLHEWAEQKYPGLADKMNAYFGEQSFGGNQQNQTMRNAELGKQIHTLCKEYLGDTDTKSGKYAANFIAHAHMRNGAVPFLILWPSGTTPTDWHQGLGTMVSFHYPKSAEERAKNAAAYWDQGVHAEHIQKALAAIPMEPPAPKRTIMI